MDTFPRTSKFVKNTPLYVVFLTLFSVFAKCGQSPYFALDILHLEQSLRFTNELITTSHLLSQKPVFCYVKPKLQFIYMCFKNLFLRIFCDNSRYPPFSSATKIWTHIINCLSFTELFSFKHFYKHGNSMALNDRIYDRISKVKHVKAVKQKQWNTLGTLHIFFLYLSSHSL